MIKLISRNLLEPDIVMSCRIISNDLLRAVFRRRVNYDEFIYFSSLSIKPL